MYLMDGKGERADANNAQVVQHAIIGTGGSLASSMDLLIANEAD